MATPLPKSPFLGRSGLLHRPTSALHQLPRFQFKASAKFDLSNLLGGRGLCNGEIGVEKELQKTISTDDKSEDAAAAMPVPVTVTETVSEEDGFDKEMMGLTGGFPGGEKGLQLFIQKNPPPPKNQKSASKAVSGSSGKPKAPELPILMPGMIAIVKNQNNPFYMYCGIVQRITDGKAGVLFEGGNWDRLITFRLEELERREKGPPMKNPKSAVFEKLLLENKEAES